MSRLAYLAIAATVGCTAGAETAADQPRKDDYTFTPEPARMYPKVADPAAPTIRELKSRGLQQTGWDADMYSCSPSCDAVYAYAIFFGHRRNQPAQNEHLFTCPNPNDAVAQDAWRCSKFTGIRGRQ